MPKRCTMSLCRRLVLLGAGASLLAACGTAQIGRDFDIQSFESRDERGRGSLPQMPDAFFKPLQVRVDAEGKVRSFSWSGEAAATHSR